jgi:DNA repair photolyase
LRWDELRIEDAGADEQEALIARASVFDRGRLVRVDTPEFAGITFHEIHARSMINKVPAASRVPFSWTINPYRGCSHACVYCFARKSHTYLGLDSGADFDSQIVVKVNAAEVVRRELAARRWRGEPIAMGTNVDCYQRAEGRYRLMPGIIEALRDAANPFSILTKGALILRDLPLLREAAERTTVGTAVSAGFLDQELWRLAEPGTPQPRRRLEVCATLNENGIGCGVLMGPVLPYLTDGPRQLDAAVRQIAEAGATSVTAIPLHLRPGAREWFTAWLRREHPELIVPYQRLYGGRSYAPKSYQERVTRLVAEAAERHGITRRRPLRGLPAPLPEPPDQLSLL